MFFDRVKELIKYSLVEIIGYLVFIFLAMIIRKSGLYYIFANLVAYGFEIIIKYILCRIFIFYQSKSRESNSFIIFIGIELLGILISNINRLLYLQSWILILTSTLIKYILNYYNFNVNKL